MSYACLAPHTRYELLGPSRAAWRDGGTPDPECVVDPDVRATFTTGDAIDETAPDAPEVLAGGCRVDVCTDGGCCGPYVAALVGVSWSAAGESGPVAFAFGAPDGPRTFATRGSYVSVVTSRVPAPRVTTELVPGSGPVYVIDGSGNVSAPTPIPGADFSCAPSPEAAAALLDTARVAEAGVGDGDGGDASGLDGSRFDASVRSADGGPASSDAPSCAARPAARGSASLALVLVVLAFVHGRIRSGRRS